MFRVTSLANMPDQQLNRWIKRLALLFVVVLIAFVAFYVVDRFRAPAAPIMDRELVALEDAVRADPTDIASRGRLADLYVAAERYDEAVSQYTEIIATGKQDISAYVSRGRAYELQGSLDSAASDYAKVVELTSDTEMANVDPRLQLAYYGLGAIALQQDKPQEAIDHLLKALTIKRTDADAMNLLGAAYVAADQADKAFEPLRKAVAFVPVGWADPYLSLADAYTATGDTAEAEWAAAMAAAMAGDVQDATTRLEAIADGPAALDAQIGLGLLAEMGGDNATAAGWYQKALTIDAANTSAQLGLSRVADGTQGHPSIMPSPSAEGSN